MAGLVSPIYDTEQERIKEQLAYANALRQKGLEGNTGSGYQGGRVFIVGNPLGNIASGLAGAYMGNKARDQQGELEKGLEQSRQDFISRMPTGIESSPQAGPVQEGEAPLPDVERQMSPRALAQATRQWAAGAPRGMEGIQGAALQQQMLAPEQEATRAAATEARKFETEQRLAAAVELQKEKIAAQLQRDRERAEDRANQIRLTASLRQSGGGTDPELQELRKDLLRAQIGKAGTPTAAQQKLDIEVAKKAEGKTSVNAAADETLLALKDAKDAGAYTTRDTSLPKSVANWGLSTEIGKDVGRAANLESQRLRDIADTKRMDLFLGSVKNTLSASQLNSDSELRTYMQTLGNPKSSYESQVEAIKYIKKNYGKQMDGGAPAAPAAASAAPTARKVFNPATGRVE